MIVLKKFRGSKGGGGRKVDEVDELVFEQQLDQRGSVGIEWVFFEIRE